MTTKNKVLQRITIVFIFMFIITIMIIVQILFIQYKQGAFWKNFDDSLHVKMRKIEAARGTIFSEEGSILSASLPFYDLYVDFEAPFMKEENGKLFKQNLDTISRCFANLFRDKTAEEYQQELILGYKKKINFYVLKKGVSYQQIQVIKTLPMISKAKNKYSSGFIFEKREKRIYPYGEMANRTIGFLRDSVDWNLGLERAYDSILRGKDGLSLMRSIAGGAYMPLNGEHITPKDGNDIVTTLNVKIQDITHTALENMLKKNEAEWGTCIVMEVATGKIKAIANLTKTKDSQYAENYNYAIKRCDPGSTFKLVSLLALLEDKYVEINDLVDLNMGEYVFGKDNGKDIIMRDSEKHKEGKTTIRHAFAISSNVGISRLIDKYYKKNPQAFIRYLKKLNLTKKTNFDLRDEEMSPMINYPNTPNWSNTTSLAWMSVGYGIEITPLQTLMIYNAIANNGKLLKPYLVSQVLDQGLLVEEKTPQLTNATICSPETLKKLKILLKTVVDSGTAKSVFKNSTYMVAGKTGTAKWLSKKGYSDSIYVSSFVGYFPQEEPKYSCIVMIKNKANAIHYYGASVAAPVFKEVSDRLMALKDNLTVANDNLEEKKESNHLTVISNKIKMPIRLFSKTLDNQKSTKTMPNLIGMTLPDAMIYLEKLKLKIQLIGNGVIVSQSILPNTTLEKDALLVLNLGI